MQGDNVIVGAFSHCLKTDSLKSWKILAVTVKDGAMDFPVHRSRSVCCLYLGSLLRWHQDSFPHVYYRKIPKHAQNPGFVLLLDNEFHDLNNWGTKSGYSFSLQVVVWIVMQGLLKIQQQIGKYIHCSCTQVDKTNKVECCSKQ